MKFKNKAENEIWMIMSEKEVLKHPEFKKENVIVEDGLARTVSPGKYDLRVNGIEVELEIRIETALDMNVAGVDANGVTFTVIKDRPIRKYDLYREIVKRFDEIKAKFGGWCASCSKPLVGDSCDEPLCVDCLKITE
jgi:hypothetical protein